MDAQGSRKTAKPRNHCEHREEVPGHNVCDQRCPRSHHPPAPPVSEPLSFFPNSNFPPGMARHHAELPQCGLSVSLKQATTFHEMLNYNPAVLQIHPFLVSLLPVLAHKTPPSYSTDIRIWTPLLELLLVHRKVGEGKAEKMISSQHGTCYDKVSSEHSGMTMGSVMGKSNLLQPFKLPILQYVPCNATTRQ